MLTRRSIVGSLPSLLAAGAFSRPSMAADESLPKANLVPGKPPMLDYGSGVLVPCDKRAFVTLWETETFWLTFGFGTSPQPERAQAEARHRAFGAMKYLLLTLAFMPERLEKVPGNGWHQIEETPANYVLGEYELPGHYGPGMTDAFRGYGSSNQSNLGGVAGVSAIGPNSSIPETGSGMGGYNPAMLLTKVNAFCTFFVYKRDVSLEDVRTRAKEVVL